MNKRIATSLSAVALLGTTLVSQPKEALGQQFSIASRATDGKPFANGPSSFDFSNWSYADHVVTNNAGVARTWTVPLYIALGVSSSISQISASSRACDGTAQLVINDATSSRFFSGSVVPCGSGTATSLTGGGFILTSPASATTAYIDFIVPPNGKVRGGFIHNF